MNLKLLKFSFKTTLPIMFGYVPLGIAFGLMFSKLGYHWVYSFLMSLFVYAGSAQFLALGMLAIHESIGEIGLMALILNSRQAFYGISLAREFNTVWRKKLYLIFGLSDEPYSIVSSVPTPPEFNKQDTYVYYYLWMHFYWVFGSTLGALIGSNLTLNTEGMDFALIALFVILTLEQIKKVKQASPFIIALSIGILSLICVERTHMLIVSIIGCILYILFKGKRAQWI